MTANDQGIYVCRATNALGQAETNAQVEVIVRNNVVTESEHEASMAQISYLESDKPGQHVQEEQAVRQPPNFSKPLRDVEVMEGQNVHLEARLLPTGDSTMKLEWTMDGRPLKTGHKFRPAYDFDYVALDLLQVYPEESGLYKCVARNAYGQAETSARVKVAGKPQVRSSSPDLYFHKLHSVLHSSLHLHFFNVFPTHGFSPCPLSRPLFPPRL